MSDQRPPKNGIKTKLPALDENAVEEIPTDDLEAVVGGNCFGTNCAPKTEGQCDRTCQTTKDSSYE